MAAQTADLIEPAFGTGDRLNKSRVWCGIRSAAVMAARINERFPDRVGVG